MPTTTPTVLVLGAAGLVGNFVATDLMRRGLPVVAVARRFTAAQRIQFGASAREIPVGHFDVSALIRFLQNNKVDLVVNCLGILQDTANDSTHNIHEAFVERLLAALLAMEHPALLVHLSIPGADADDRTDFSRSKRDAERLIAQSGVPYAILRAGFIFAPAAYGGSAMLRALAALPFALPDNLASRPFATAAVDDVVETITVLIRRWPEQVQNFRATWDLMHPEQRSLGVAVTSLRLWLGTALYKHAVIPMFWLKIGAKAGDVAGWLGWRPPIRSTALAELARGVKGEPATWMAATGIKPRALDSILHENPATVQEKWFARLYLLKALVIVSLAVFWCVSALIALTVAYDAAVAILTAHGYPDKQAQFMTIAGGVMDFSIGVAIAVRRISRWGLLCGIAVSLFYMLAAAVLTPELWVEPLGALVKTVPAIVLMLVALAISDDR